MLQKWLPENASSFGGDIDFLIALISVVVGIWFVAAEAVLIGFAIRYRRRDGKRAAYVPGDTWRSLSWVLVPVALILVCDFGIDAVGADVWSTVKETIAPPQERILIKSKQFVWEIVYAGKDGRLETQDDIRILNDLTVPVDAVVQFDLESEDVVHSLWLPHLRLKQDAVPGRVIRGWFKATKVGTFGLACAELCGVGHGRMGGELHVLPPERYRDWLASQQPRDAFWEE